MEKSLQSNISLSFIKNHLTGCSCLKMSSVAFSSSISRYRTNPSGVGLCRSSYVLES